MKELFRVIKFTLISISAGIIQIGLFALLNELLKWNYWVAYLTSLLASILWNFTINRKVTFKSSNNLKLSMLLVLLFYAVFTPVSTVLGQMAEGRGVNEYIVLAVTMLSNFVLEFLYTRYVVYYNTCDTAVEKVEGNPFKKKRWHFKAISSIVKFFYKRTEYIGVENLPKEECIIVGNHAQMHGPLTSELYFPTTKGIWCTGEMISMKEFPQYAYEDFWSKKPKAVRWFYKSCAYLLAPFGVYLFKNADTIPVYRDSRVMATFKNTLKTLENGTNVIIFPEGRCEFNEVVNDFQQNFTDLAKLYYKKTGKRLAFIPMYLAPKLKKAVIGKPIYYDPNKDWNSQKIEICEYLKEEITSLAKSLPAHKIVPYDNVGRKNYQFSK